MPIPKFLIVTLILLATSCAYEEFQDPAYFIPNQPADMGEGTPDSGLDATATDAAEADDATDPIDLGGDMGDVMVDAGGDSGGADSGDDAGADMGTDMGCQNVNEPLTVDTSGSECTPYVSDIGDLCDPVYQTGCNIDQVCVLRLVLNGNIPTGFTPGCIPYRCAQMTKQPGEACGTGECTPGSHCLEGVCRRRCKLDGATACQPGEFCVGSGVSKEYGSCLAECS